MSPPLHYVGPENQLTRTWDVLLVDASFKGQVSICLWNYQEVLKYLLRLWKIIRVLPFYFFFNVVRVECKVLWAGIQLAQAAHSVISFATAATEKHDTRDTLAVLAVQSIWPLNCCCQTWISWEAVAGEFVQVIDIFLRVEIYLLGLF